AALLGRPRNIVLDEPMNGLDPQGMEWMRAFLRDAAASGHAVLVSSHLLGEMETLADRLVVIDNGRLLGQWDVADLLHARSRQALLRTDDDERVEQALRGLRVPVTALPEGLCVTFDETVPDALTLSRTCRDLDVLITALTDKPIRLEEEFLARAFLCRTWHRKARAMTRALTAEVRRLLTVRSTGIFAALLIGCCVGPIVLMGIVYDPAYRGPIDAGDLGKCVSIFHVLALVFAGTHTATEINAGSTALSFLTQKSRWASLAAQAAVQWAFLAFAYVVGIGLALVAARFYPDGLAMSPRGWAYLAAYLLVVLLWVTMATALAVLTRSVAVSVAAPITWMLLIE